MLQGVLEEGDEQLRELLCVLLDRGVQPQLADEVGRVRVLALCVLHHRKEGLEAGHLAPGLVEVGVQDGLVVHLLRVLSGVPLVQGLEQFLKRIHDIKLNCIIKVYLKPIV